MQFSLELKIYGTEEYQQLRERILLSICFSKVYSHKELDFTAVSNSRFGIFVILTWNNSYHEEQHPVSIYVLLFLSYLYLLFFPQNYVTPGASRRNARMRTANFCGNKDTGRDTYYFAVMPRRFSRRREF